MPTKSELKYISKLLLKKYRETEKKFIAEGKRFVEEGLKSNYSCEVVLVNNDFKQKEIEYYNLLKTQGVEIFIIQKHEFEKIASTQHSQGVLAVFKIPEKIIELNNEKTIICLENISDPGNVGTILRSCDWFGIKTVLLSKNSAELYNPKVLRSSMGAIFNLNILENADIISEIEKLKSEGYNTYYSDMEGQDYRKIDFNKKSVITFCNEAFGPTDKLKDICDTSITIPKKGNIESLNVAAAAAVILSSI